MFNSTVIGTDFVSFTSFAAVMIFLVDFLEELFELVPLDILLVYLLLVIKTYFNNVRLIF
jgi:hypothetical protein